LLGQLGRDVGYAVHVEVQSVLEVAAFDRNDQLGEQPSDYWPADG
jgi:hypothetical protein